MSADQLSLKTQSPAETEALGKALLGLLPEGAVVALRGELATGKTCLVRGMAESLRGEHDIVSSPTFTLVHEYGADKKLYHLDLYRIETAAEVIELGCEELFEPEDGICVVEWAERAESLLPSRRVDITLAHAGEDERNIVVENRDTLSQGWQRAVEDSLAASRDGRAKASGQTGS